MKIVAERGMVKESSDHWVYLHGEGKDLVGFICSKTEEVRI